MGYTFSTHVKLVSTQSQYPPQQMYKELCEWYQQNHTPEPVMSDIWSTITGKYLRELDYYLMHGDSVVVKSILDFIYDSDRLTGLDNGSETFKDEQLSTQIWEGACITAANALGVLPVFNSEQPVEKVLDVEELITSMEKVLGFSLDTVPAGNVYGAMVGKRFIPLKVLYGIPTLATIERIHTWPMAMVEIGAGVGFCCQLAMKKWPELVYHIVDLPIISVIQAYLLSVQVGYKYISFDPNNISYGSINICGQKKTPKNIAYDIILNQNSLPEIPREVGLEYLKWIQGLLRYQGTFISINHESDLGGQHRVCDLAKETAGLRCVGRFPFWPRYCAGRSDYVVELFKTA